MKRAFALAVLGLMLTAHGLESPAYVREGDRVEQQFREHRDRLAQFFQELRTAVQQEAPIATALLQQLQNPPPQANVYGYQILPRVVDIPQPRTPISTFSYSWPITEGYVGGEVTKLERARTDLARAGAMAAEERSALLSALVTRYRELVRDQRTVDQYIQYNRFWQRELAEDRTRFDRLNEVYSALKTGGADNVEAIRKVLGRPQAPNFLRIRRQGQNRVTLGIRLYTDIEDPAYLSQVKAVLEKTWSTKDAGQLYAVEIDLRRVPTRDLYRRETSPSPGDHIDIEKHVARFPSDGGILTTGAQFTHGAAARYVALGPGDLAPRTLAHEFGHVLGFTDGYVRGYADLGDRGFEILELTSFFDDIMSAPREGRVQPAHFKLILEALGR